MSRSYNSIYSAKFVNLAKNFCSAIREITKYDFPSRFDALSPPSFVANKYGQKQNLCSDKRRTVVPMIGSPQLIPSLRESNGLMPFTQANKGLIHYTVNFCIIIIIIYYYCYPI